MVPVPEAQTAPTYTVPLQRIVSIEHPCIIKNLEKGVKSLGGEAQIKHVLEHKVGDGEIRVNAQGHVYAEPVVGVSLRSDDVLAKKMPSTGVKTRNVLVRVSVPKWTGRKRKRGSVDPFEPAPLAEANETSIKAPDLLRRLRDHDDSYELEALGVISETHRFRGQPDFQMHTRDIPIMREVESHLLTSKYEDFKKFKVDLTPGRSANDMLPLPPNLHMLDQPYRYEYQQANDVKYLFNAQGTPIAINTNAYSNRRLGEALAPDAPDVPTGPPEGLRLSGRQEKNVLAAIKLLKELLNKRPLVSRRVIASEIPQYSEGAIKEATEWVGYSFSAGPWRDILIKFGVDPRTDPKYRFYQTMLLSFDKTLGSAKPGAYINKANRKESATRKDHLFDGKTVRPSIKSWQVCDIVDPMLHSILQTEVIRSECEVHQSGWFHPGTLAKVRVILRDKARCLLVGEAIDEVVYAPIVGFPDVLTMEEDFAKATVQKDAGDRVMELVGGFRAMGKLYGKRDRYTGRSREETESSAPVGDGREQTLEVEEDGQREVDDREADVDGDGDEIAEATEENSQPEG
ncbi:tau 95 subunit of transcription factor TFIIIC [Recurvomyces mirabilis]|uniref:Tau 95 subunit of transcription factor TFIIIC n=1 Tax=Recurvomyces mirabilis TaxID=574656 RepID=A0AAE0WXR0_9PEZI|nr:tau 95 subunit of transcription factor TFIIIC [Recurvomyces mirabilis]KAK5161930.1 tau 95 subunit of transcription factor TFIIIC [Recurvomyces mirabilis]